MAAFWVIVSIVVCSGRQLISLKKDPVLLGGVGFEVSWCPDSKCRQELPSHILDDLTVFRSQTPQVAGTWINSGSCIPSQRPTLGSFFGRVEAKKF